MSASLPPMLRYSAKLSATESVTAASASELTKRDNATPSATAACVNGGQTTISDGENSSLRRRLASLKKTPLSRLPTLGAPTRLDVLGEGYLRLSWMRPAWTMQSYSSRASRLFAAAAKVGHYASICSWMSTSQASLEMDDPAFVEDLMVCCDKYIEFLEARTSLRYEEWHSLMLRTHKVESLFPAYTEPDNTLEEEDGDDEAAALEMRINRVLRRPFRLRALSSYYRVGRPVDDDFRAAMVDAIRSQPPLNAAEVRTLISACDLWLLIDDVKYAKSEKMLEKLSDDELETWFDSHRSHVCEEVQLKMQQMRDLGDSVGSSE